MKAYRIFSKYEGGMLVLNRIDRKDSISLTHGEEKIFKSSGEYKMYEKPISAYLKSGKIGLEVIDPKDIQEENSDDEIQITDVTASEEEAERQRLEAEEAEARAKAEQEEADKAEAEANKQDDEADKAEALVLLKKEYNKLVKEYKKVPMNQKDKKAELKSRLEDMKERISALKEELGHED